MLAGVCTSSSSRNGLQSKGISRRTFSSIPDLSGMPVANHVHIHLPLPQDPLPSANCLRERLTLISHYNIGRYCAFAIRAVPLTRRPLLHHIFLQSLAARSVPRPRTSSSSGSLFGRSHSSVLLDLVSMLSFPALQRHLLQALCYIV